ncbi:MAG: sigma-70 family RNA polymerase sigma factor [Alphaproteobacteria bacterium]|nr:sigma-70 family RNA polymerase sigma factor [Alphaproteobacteria bacterium]
MRPAVQKQSAPDFSALIVNVARHRDRQSFITLFEYFAPRIKSFLIKGGVAEEMADELAQETMLSVWQKADHFDPARSAASTWIYTIARNKRIDAFRKTGRVEITPPDYVIENQPADDETSNPAQALMHAQEGQGLAQALAALPPEQADLIRRAFFEEKSHAQIAQETKIPLGTIKSRIRLGLERLAQQEGVQNLWS